MTFELRSSDGTMLSVRRSGDSPPVLLVHGAVADKESFVLIEPLLRESRTVWVYDRRGHGTSGDAPHYSIGREAQDVLAVLDAASDSGKHMVDVVAHSYGAVCALLALDQAPMRSLAMSTYCVSVVARQQPSRRARRPTRERPSPRATRRAPPASGAVTGPLGNVEDDRPCPRRLGHDVDHSGEAPDNPLWRVNTIHSSPV